MKNRFLVIAAVALGAAAVTPTRAHASAPPINCAAGIGTFQLGFGGYFSNCWAGFQVSRYFENAGHVSNMYWFNGLPTRDPGTNGPLPASGTLLFNNDCGSNGSSLPGAFCVPQQTQLIIWGGSTSELVFGLHKLNNGGWWLYSGTDATRNDPAPPGGIQNYLWKISGGIYDGQFLLGWEDLNSGCLSANSSTGNNIVTDPGTINGDNLDTLLASCTNANASTSIEVSDDDYNDFYAIINPLNTSELTEIVVPEPASMMLLATGLLGLGGVSLRRRRR